MLVHCSRVTPGAHFVAGFGEHLPFATGAVDLITAAGAINYTDRERFLPEVRRVLKPTGAMVLYDFSPGRRFRNDASLSRWFDAFEGRYPAEPGYALDVTALPYERFGLRLERFQPVEPVVPMTASSYLDYVLTETGVEIALAAGTPESEIREWCRSTLAPVFGGAPRDVLFDAYVADVRPVGTGTSG
jgi:ubiquinone/menaquinone biosynthesis C-methylase UbiE